MPSLTPDSPVVLRADLFEAVRAVLGRQPHDAVAELCAGLDAAWETALRSSKPKAGPQALSPKAAE